MFNKGLYTAAKYIIIVHANAVENMTLRTSSIPNSSKDLVEGTHEKYRTPSRSSTRMVRMLRAWLIVRATVNPSTAESKINGNRLNPGLNQIIKTEYEGKGTASSQAAKPAEDTCFPGEYVSV